MVHKMEFYAAVKKNDIEKSVGKGVKLEVTQGWLCSDEQILHIHIASSWILLHIPG